jgi:hypothetical protein
MTIMKKRIKNIIGVYIGITRIRVLNVREKLLKIPKSKLLITAATLAALAIFVLGSYNIYSTDYLKCVAAITSSFTVRETNV